MTGILRRGGSLVSIHTMDDGALRTTGEDAFRPRCEFGSTSPCKGEVGRKAAGRGSRFARTTAMTSRARRLRGRSTDAEKKLWRALRRDQINGLSFRRQHPIGPYVLDFYCPAIGLAIELDGGQHALREGTDVRRTRWLNAKGIIVLRFWNNDVHGNLQGVLSEMARVAQTRARLRLSASVKGGRVGSRPPPGELTLADLPLSGGGDGGGSSAVVFGEVDR